ncbi:DUF3180 domain-containing protein [Flindersiella endophytica]
MRTTQFRLVIGLFALGAALGWTAVAFFRTGAQAMPGVPWSTPGALLFFAALLGVGAWYMYDRVHRKRRGVDAMVAVRLLVLAKASAIVGALVGGGYTGFALRFVASFDSPDGRDRVVRGFVTAATGVLVVVAALILERACKVPKDEDGEASNGGSREQHPETSP